MRAQKNCFTVICKHHHGIDACEPWSEFAVIVDDVKDPSRAAAVACRRLIKENGGKAVATMVIAGRPKLHAPENCFFDSEDDDLLDSDDDKVVSYREVH